MSSCERNRKKKVRKQSNIELSSIITFIKLIQSIFCGMFGISIIGLILTLNNPSAKVLYTMVIVISLIVIILGRFPIKYLTRKSTDNSIKKKVIENRY
ncbi:hypothetical protein [Clostridium tertium]|uniref:hypothetical protein n=1 Tax=Clostridium tertium TaxID=1559 RepID=UPI0024201C45|nr:hypothetical protein [Clostridium tertium]